MQKVRKWCLNFEKTLGLNQSLFKSELNKLQSSITDIADGSIMVAQQKAMSSHVEEQWWYWKQRQNANGTLMGINLQICSTKV